MAGLNIVIPGITGEPEPRGGASLEKAAHMNLTTLFSHLGIALGLGLLVGLQRESVASRLAGLRTFPLITLLGAVTGILSQLIQPQGAWLMAAGALALAILILSGKETDSRSGHLDPGLTTEIAILLMYGVGALLIVGPAEIAIAIGGITAVLLHFKGELQTAVARLTSRDMRVIMQFALISLVILPVLPNRTYGPYQVINPRHIWLMVVLIVGLSLTGYIAWKFFGEKTGLLLSGVLGGLISSTAATVSFSRRSKTSAEDSRGASIVILIATAIVYLRVMVEMAAVSTTMLQHATVPILILLLINLVGVVIFWGWGSPGSRSLPEQENPSELRSALFFAGLYALVLFLVALTTDKFGNRGLFLLAGISGLTDVDAITLSTAQLVRLDRLSATEAWRVVVLAILANLAFKLGTIIFLGVGILRQRVSVVILTKMAVGLLLIRYWPI
jgi:uncharacterized membrane protein (DUF4010 family)